MRGLTYTFLAFGFILAIACSERKEKELKSGSIEYIIHGNVKNVADKTTVYLEAIQDQNWISIDSVQTTGGVFDMKGHADGVEVYKLRFNNNLYIPVFLDGKPVDFTAEVNDLFGTISFKNHKENQTYAEFNRHVIDLNKQHGILTAKLDALKYVNKTDSADVYMMQIKSLEAEMKAFIKKSIDDNVDSPIVFSMITYADWQNDFPYIESVTNKIKQNLPDNKYTSNLVSNVNKQKSYLIQQQEKDKNNPAAIGKEAPEFALPDVAGNMIRLSSYRGKYVLLDFWASWCGPCRQESPNVVQAYNKYKSDKFDILSVSLDQSRDKWLQAIEKDGLVWKHVSELKSWQSSIVSLYKIEGIPATFLLDPNGIVIARDLRGSELESKLEELLKK